MVNARSSPSFHFDQVPFGPTTLELLIQSVRLPMDRYSTESIAALNDVITEWRQRARARCRRAAPRTSEPPGGALPDVAFSVVEVSFDAVSDPVLRSQLQTCRRRSRSLPRRSTGCATPARGCSASRLPFVPSSPRWPKPARRPFRQPSRRP